jgi:hypothetical protein
LRKGTSSGKRIFAERGGLREVKYYDFTGFDRQKRTGIKQGLLFSAPMEPSAIDNWMTGAVSGKLELTFP